MQWQVDRILSGTMISKPPTVEDDGKQKPPSAKGGGM
jgi:hypothetical protein